MIKLLKKEINLVLKSAEILENEASEGTKGQCIVDGFKHLHGMLDIWLSTTSGTCFGSAARRFFGYGKNPIIIEIEVT